MYDSGGQNYPILLRLPFFVMGLSLEIDSDPTNLSAMDKYSLVGSPINGAKNTLTGYIPRTAPKKGCSRYDNKLHLIVRLLL